MMQTYDSIGGFNARRKRQIDLSRLRNMKVEHVTGIRWDDEMQPESEEVENESGWEEATPAPSSEFEQQKRKALHVVPRAPGDAMSTMCLDGKPIRFQGKRRDRTFEESHIRFTSYLEHDLFHVVHTLKKQGHIRSITELVNESIKHYLTCKDA
jgi:hypothetical protein